LLFLEVCQVENYLNDDNFFRISESEINEQTVNSNVNVIGFCGGLKDSDCEKAYSRFLQLTNYSANDFKMIAFFRMASNALPSYVKLISPGVCSTRQDGIICYNCSTSRGFSGSPIIISGDQGLRFIGVHTHPSQVDVFNVGIDTNTQLFREIYGSVMTNVSRM